MRKRCFIIPLILLLIAGIMWTHVSKTLRPAAPGQRSSALSIRTSAEADAVEEEKFVPTRSDVLDARERCLKGLTSEQFAELKKTVVSANLWWENGYMSDNIFSRLEDPDSLYWNYFDPALTGEIQIGWAVDGGLDKEAVCAEEDLTEAEFYAKYGTKVVTGQHYDTEGFIAAIESISEAAADGAMKADLQYLANELRLAVENHSMDHANNMYKMLHDMDYFLLRYGPEDVGKYLEKKGFVSRYYGTLSVYS